MSDIVADRRVHPGTIAIRFLKAAPRTVLAVPAIIAIGSDRGMIGGLAIAAGLSGLALIFQWLHWRQE